MTVVPTPPRMHWAVLIILCALTGGLFGAIWLIVQANWTRQMRGRGVALSFAITNCVFYAHCDGGGVCAVDKMGQPSVPMTIGTV